MERATDIEELLDGPLDAETLAGNLRDLVRINRWLGGVALSRRALLSLLRGRDSSVDLLDVGTGAADIPLALIGWLGRHGRRMRVTAVDTRPEVLTAAQQLLAATRQRAAAQNTDAAWDSLTLELVPGDRLPYPDLAFDMAHCSLVMHHTQPPEAQSLLAEMARVSRTGIVVNDLDRGRLAWLGAVLLTRVATRNRYTRHDAPLSVRRAYRPAEVAQMASRVGLVERARFHDPLRHRYAIAFVRAPAGAQGSPPRGE